MSDISTHYGGSLLALKGKNSVLMISDLRLGQSNITINKNFSKISKISNLALIGLTTFVPDCQILLKKIQKNVNLFHLNENFKNSTKNKINSSENKNTSIENEIDAFEATNLLSYLLYSKRFQPYFVESIVCGFDTTNNENEESSSLIASLDQIGCISFCNFAACGTASKKLYGLCEALYREDLDDESLFVTGAQIFLNSIDRDALSGYGAECYLLKRDGLVVRKLKGRMD
ncbi:Proteasome subunit beta type-3 [Dictyocoela muelleri]|nr:Proteasome subunit beta type-3 [Dictyocoela muelleri]